MAIKIRSMKNIGAGLLYIALGLLFALGVVIFKYSMGTASRMGPGYFPSILGWLLTLLGVIILIRAFTVDGEKPAPVAWRPLLLGTLGSVCLFAALINTAGLMPACVVLVIVAALGGPDFSWKEALFSAIFLAIVVWLIFSVGLGLPFRLWPWSF